MWYDLDACSNDNRRDVRAYIQACAARADLHAWLVRHKKQISEFVDDLCNRSEGNFMYLHQVLAASEQWHPAASAQCKLPRELREYYRQHWAQMLIGADTEAEVAQGLAICLLASARKPLSLR